MSYSSPFSSFWHTMLQKGTVLVIISSEAVAGLGAEVTAERFSEAIRVVKRLN